MVYQIYYGYERPGEVLFDIEYYVAQDPTPDGSLWHVELHCVSFVSGAVNFITTALPKTKKDEFIKDCHEIEELRGWVWETHRNPPRPLKSAQDDMRDWRRYIEAKLTTFCNKYGLHINED